jgi:hypothetical protein
MVVSTRLAVAVIGGLLLATVYTPAWAGSANDTTISGGSTSVGAATSTGTSSSAPGADHSLVGVLGPLLADAAPHQAQKRCQPETLYSQHDVIGDPDVCLLNRVNVPIF